MAKEIRSLWADVVVILLSLSCTSEYMPPSLVPESSKGWRVQAGISTFQCTTTLQVSGQDDMGWREAVDCPRRDVGIATRFSQSVNLLAGHSHELIDKSHHACSGPAPFGDGCG